MTQNKTREIYSLLEIFRLGADGKYILTHNNCHDSQLLFNSLLHFKVLELKAICKLEDLKEVGNKLELINAILYKRNYIALSPSFRARNSSEQSLSLSQDIEDADDSQDIEDADDSQAISLSHKIDPSYRNNHLSRKFFSSYIDNFKFKVFMLDWLKTCFKNKYYPTYAEYISVYKQKIIQSHELKQEWAYLRFIKGWSQSKKDSNNQDMAQAWHAERMRQIKIGERLLGYEGLISERKV